MAWEPDTLWSKALNYLLLLLGNQVVRDGGSELKITMKHIISLILSNKLFNLALPHKCHLIKDEVAETPTLTIDKVL